MTTDDLTDMGGNLPATDAANMMEMMKNIMDRLTQQDESNKTTNDRLNAIITSLVAYINDPVAAFNIDMTQSHFTDE